MGTANAAAFLKCGSGLLIFEIWFRLAPPHLLGLYLYKLTRLLGDTIGSPIGTVTLDKPAPEETEVGLRSDSNIADVLNSVTIAAGDTSAMLNIVTISLGYNETKTVAIIASLNEDERQKELLVKGPRLA